MSTITEMLDDDVGQAVTIPAWVRDLDSFRRWAHSDAYPETGRVSYLGGEIEVDMNAEHVQNHNSPKMCLTAALGMMVDGDDLGELYADGVLLTNDAANLACEPDLAFANWETLTSGRLEYVSRATDEFRPLELRGTPDLVVEIVSRSSARKDKKVLRERYFLAGIPEYWLVDCRGKVIQFSVLVRAAAEYAESPVDADGFAYSPVFGRSFRLTRSLNRVGHWRYALEDRGADSPPGSTA
jgi:Uma2 family endonuclease